MSLWDYTGEKQDTDSCMLDNKVALELAPAGLVVVCSFVVTKQSCGGLAV